MARMYSIIFFCALWIFSASWRLCGIPIASLVFLWRGHSNRCLMVSWFVHSHRGGGSFLNRCSWVSFKWPILILFNFIWSVRCLSCLNVVVVLSWVWLILRFSDLACWFHVSYIFVLVYVLMSVLVMWLNVRVLCDWLCYTASFAALSVFSFPSRTVWPGTHRNWKFLWCFSRSSIICCLCCIIEFLFGICFMLDRETDESVHMRKLLLSVWLHKSTAFWMTMSSEDRVVVGVGRENLWVFCCVTTAHPTPWFFLDASVNIMLCCAYMVDSFCSYSCFSRFSLVLGICRRSASDLTVVIVHGGMLYGLYGMIVGIFILKSWSLEEAVFQCEFGCCV